MTEASRLLTDALLHPREAARQARDPSRPRMTWRQDLVTCMLATWLIQGLTMDAWAHTNQTSLETVVINTGHGLKTLDAVSDRVGAAVTIEPSYAAFVATGIA